MLSMEMECLGYQLLRDLQDIERDQIASLYVQLVDDGSNRMNGMMG